MIGYPARPVAKPGHEADLKKRTLSHLYNARPTWLNNTHKTLDAAVANKGTADEIHAVYSSNHINCFLVGIAIVM